MDVGVDVGGTFTDFVGFRGASVVTTKLPTSRDPADAVRAGIRELGAIGMSHGTTVATNAILQRTGARTAFVTTAGFEDLLMIGRQNRPSLYDLRVTRPTPPVGREFCFGLGERVDASGKVVVRASPRQIERVARAVRRSGAESVAISLLFSFLRPEHEPALARALGTLPTSVSHEVLAEFREYERSSTTVLDAYIKPLVERYLTGLEATVPGDFYVMKSSGGVVPHRAVMRRPIEIVVSGPAGGVAAAVALGNAIGERNVFTFDMGGTSADFSTIVGGVASWTSEAVVDTFPIALPIVDIESVGAGGGSVAWIDSGRALRVGPQSAGADPGPIAYGKGGASVTVTDADLVAGVLGPSLIGGRLPLRIDLAAKGIARLAETTHLPEDETVLAVQRVVRAKMGKAMRLVLARRGLDPREFALLAYGGAGPMHACALAREIGIPRVIVPFLPGAFSAFGILISPVQLEYSRTVVRPIERSNALIAQTIFDFETRARKAFRTNRLDPREAVFSGSVDLRYRGQSYELNVPIRGNLEAAFRREHRRRYGYAARAAPIELVTVRLVGRIPRPIRMPAAAVGSEARISTRHALFDDGWTAASVLERNSLSKGYESEGPAIIAEADATTVVPPHCRFRIGSLGTIEIEVAA